jgi:hypothetical protein
MIRKKSRGAVVLLLILLLIPACATHRNELIQDRVLTVDSSGRASVDLPYGKGVRITGEAFIREDGSWIFHTDVLEWFSNWHKGWTRARFGMTGSFLLKPAGDSRKIEILEFPRIISVLEGQVRYREKRYYGDRSRDIISRRWTRASAASSYIRNTLNLSSYPFIITGEGYDSKEFRKDLERLLFPEVYGYGAAFPPPPYWEGPEDRYVEKEEVLWDRSYSRTYIPPELQPVRDSGTLFRDYWECSGFFILGSTWDLLWEEILPQSDFILRRVADD